MAVRYHPRCPYCKVYLENSDRPAYYDSPLGILWELKKRNKTEQRRLDAWEKSAQRLQDTNYAALLANHGYSVPPQYLPPEYKYDPLCRQ